MEFEFRINFAGFSESDYDTFLEAAKNRNARVIISFLSEEEDGARFCDEDIAEAVHEALGVAMTQGYTFALIKEGDEVAIDFYNGSPNRTGRRLN